MLPLLLGSDIADDLEFLHEIGWGSLERSHVLLTGVPVTCSVVVLTCGIVAAFRFFRKQRSTSAAMIVLLVGLVIRRVSKSFLVGIFVYGKDERLLAAILAMIVYVLPDILNAAIWTRYFRKSRRVRETFVN